MLLDRAREDEKIDYDAFINHESCWVESALRESAMNNHCDTIKLLISRHDELNYVTRMHGKTAMDWARKYAREELTLHCRLQAKIKHLFMSISCGDLQGVKRVINRGTKYKFNRVSLLEEEVKTLERNIECTTHRFKEIEKSLEITKAELTPVEESSNKDTQKLTEKKEVAETNSEKNVEGNSVIALKEKLSADIHEFIDMNSPPA